MLRIAVAIFFLLCAVPALADEDESLGGPPAISFICSSLTAMDQVVHDLRKPFGPEEVMRSVRARGYRNIECGLAPIGVVTRFEVAMKYEPVLQGAVVVEHWVVHIEYSSGFRVFVLMSRVVGRSA